MLEKKTRASFVGLDPVLTPEEKAKFERDYELTADAQKTCGQIILAIMDKKKISPLRATQLTGLNQSVFRKLKDPKCTIPKPLVVSIGVGFGLDVHLTEYILESNGMCFNTNERLDKAYISLIEEHKGKDIETCNAILRDFGGIEEKHFLGAHERGLYKPRKKP